MDLAQLEGRAIELNCKNLDLNESIPLFLTVFGTKPKKDVKLVFLNENPGPIHVLADQGALQRIVLNLVGNGIKFTEKGKIEISIGLIENEAFVRIRDTGSGIDANFLPKMFETFSQESSGAARLHEGSGLGLAITKQLVDLLSGRITVESEKGVGSQFTVFLPFVDMVKVKSSPTSDVSLNLVSNK